MLVRQIAEHSHYVQGVAWDPLNEYIATQSSDRSVHIYSLKTKDGQYTLTSHGAETPKVASHAKMDLPPRRISSNSPAPPDLNYRAQLASRRGCSVNVNWFPRVIGAGNTTVCPPADESTQCGQSQ